MIAIDTNLLVYAHREDSPWHERSWTLIRGLAEGSAPWAIPWPCLHEFLAAVTHPRIYDPPTPLEIALDQAEAWLASPSLVLLGEGPVHWKRLRELLQTGCVVGGAVGTGACEAQRSSGPSARARRRDGLITGTTHNPIT